VAAWSSRGARAEIGPGGLLHPGKTPGPLDLAQAGAAAAAYGELKSSPQEPTMERLPRLSSVSRVSRVSHGLLAGAALLAGLAATSARAAPDGDAMLTLAAKSGCMACHHIDPGAKGPNGLPPVGPAWRDVSNKYSGQRGAEDSLTRTVLGGSNPYLSHWKGQASGLAMPPNQVAISEADARKLVKWILALAPTK